MGEDTGFFPVCLACLFLSAQTFRASSARCSREFQGWDGSTWRTSPLSPNPSPAIFLVSYLILYWKTQGKASFWVTFCMLPSLLLSSTQNIALFFFFFGRIFSSPSHASLSTYGAFQWSSSLIKSTCLWKMPWIWMLSHLMGMQSWNPLHFLYNLLIEWYLKF